MSDIDELARRIQLALVKVHFGQFEPITGDVAQAAIRAELVKAEAEATAPHPMVSQVGRCPQCAQLVAIGGLRGHQHSEVPS